MRILEVSNFMPPHPGGIEIMIDTLFQGLQRRGHDVRWIAASTPLEPGTTGPFVRVSAWNWLEKNLHVPMPLWAPSGWKELDEQVRWADVIHVHDCLYFSSSLTTALSKGRKKPLLVTQHVGEVPYGGVLDWVQAAAYRTLGRTLLSAASEVVTYSPHVVDYFQRVGVKKPLRIIPLGFDPRFKPLSEQERMEARREFGLPGKGALVLFAARLVPKKGVHRVAELQRLLASEGVTLVVAGDGPLASEVSDLPNTVHLRQVDHARMHLLYGCADALLLPSVGEGLPLTLQEGMSTGLPAVVSRDPSFVANVSDAPGVRLEEGLSAQAEALREVLSNPPPRSDIADWAKARWGLERFVTEYERTLEALTKNR